jgi:hypothetical protein
MIRRMVMPGGQRLAPLNKPKIAGMCPVCSKHVFKKLLYGSEQAEGIWRNGSYYHYACNNQDLHTPCYSRRPEAQRGSDQVWKGNLGDAEYQFWIGHKESYNRMAMCRACRATIYGDDKDRARHFRDETRKVGGDQCSVRLVNVYKRIQCFKTCIVCKKMRFNHSKWGVPLCDSAECLNKWKFGCDPYQAIDTLLELQFKQVSRPSMATQLQQIREVRSDDQMERIKHMVMNRRVWCEHCQMFTDNALHMNRHSTLLDKGEFIEES